jgi:hypothetical protein
MLPKDTNVASEKVVLAPTRIDLHIHSAASTRTRDGKDKALAQCDSSEGALSILTEQLELHGINMCAITDHDIFDLFLYQRLKAKEGEGSLKKVLPGVEFTVSYVTGKGEHDEDTKTTIHIVAIFDDRNPEKLTHLNDLLIGPDGKPKYDDIEERAFSEEAFKRILGEAGMGSVLIGHEKSAGRSAKRDVSSLGAELADEIVLAEYIDAMEISDRNAEIQIRNFVKSYTHPDVPFVLGSDCHNWAAYPLHDSSQESIRDRKTFSSIKALPTFEGLVMAITDTSRIKVGDCSFFARSSTSINELDLTVAGHRYAVPMSPGINVIIGDNSIGKSMLLHAITNYRELDSKRDKSVIAGYKGYCEREKLDIRTTIPSCIFDSQQSVRRKLEGLHDGAADGPFEKYYHKRVDVEVARQTVRSFFQEGLDALCSKLAYNDKLAELESLDVVALNKPPVSKTVSIGRKVSVPNLRDVNALVSDLDLEIGHLKSLLTKHSAVAHKIGGSFIQEVSEAIAHLGRARELASSYRDQEAWRITKVNAFNGAAAVEKELLLEKKTDEDKDFDAFSVSLENASEALSELTSLRWDEVSREFVAPQVGNPTEDNPMGEFHFVSELNTKAFDEEYRDRLLEKAFLKGKVPSIVEGIEGSTALTTSRLIDWISNGNPKPSEWKAFVMNRLEDGIQEIRERPKITNTEIGLDSEPSAGLYGQIYFELIGQDDDLAGVYIIDQPEDQISQRAIRKHVLSDFKRMAEKRQVILVTHNPQFVVNLDADNVIALDRDKTSGHICVQSGALEYECEEYSILDVVANTVEGGADVVRKRLKRYGGQLRSREQREEESAYV